MNLFSRDIDGLLVELPYVFQCAVLSQLCEWQMKDTDFDFFSTINLFSHVSFTQFNSMCDFFCFFLHDSFHNNKKIIFSHDSVMPTLTFFTIPLSLHRIFLFIYLLQSFIFTSSFFFFLNIYIYNRNSVALRHKNKHAIK